MNIETLAEYIGEWHREVIESGFKRDVGDYVGTLSNNQSNVIGLREIGNKLLAGLEGIVKAGIPDSLEKLLPAETQERVFTGASSPDALAEILQDSSIPQQELFSRLQQFTNSLHSRLNQTESQIKKVEAFIQPYVQTEEKRLVEEQTAVLAIVFKDKTTTSSLKGLTKAVSIWNRELLFYHQLIKKDSPQDIALLEVQNGSVEFVVNLDLDVALNLVDVFKVCFKCFVAYLTYKTIRKPVTETFFGNQKLLKHEEKSEELWLENIGAAVQKTLEKQHKKAKVKVDNSKKMIDHVRQLVTSHVVKGNDIKLLGFPKSDAEETEKMDEQKYALRGESVEARHQLKLLPQEDKQHLLEMYGKAKDEGEPA